MYEDKSGKFRFRLKASNGQIVASGEAYESMAAARRGAEAVAHAAETAPSIPDSSGNETRGPEPRSGVGRFEVYQDRAGKYRFRLKASNGQIIASGEAYETRAAAIKGAESVKNAATGAKSQRNQRRKA
ncbi:hypothetical protein GCM10023200_39290 [Actinomycetospora chlora]|uniref:DUF1508 domain-containing protein n=1 Tax=Actinomycetospora chlora TaxID=663608 RepID=A0ABP9BU87_9PSEU